MRGKCDKCGEIKEDVYEFIRNDMSTGRIHLCLCYDCGYEVQEFILGNHSLSETVKGDKRNE